MILIDLIMFRSIPKATHYQPKISSIGQAVNRISYQVVIPKDLPMITLGSKALLKFVKLTQLKRKQENNLYFLRLFALGRVTELPSPTCT